MASNGARPDHTVPTDDANGTSVDNQDAETTHPDTAGHAAYEAALLCETLASDPEQIAARLQAAHENAAAASFQARIKDLLV